MATRCIAGVLALTFAASAPAIDLRPRFDHTPVTHYRSRATLTTLIEAGGLDGSPVTIETEAIMQLRITAQHADGGAALEWTLLSMVVRPSAELPGIAQSLAYDSRDPAAQASPLAPMFGQLVGRPLSVTVDRRGKVLAIGNRPPGLPAQVLDPVLGGFFQPAMFEQLPFFVTADAPAPARRRARWTQRVDLPVGLEAGSVVLETENTLLNHGRQPRVATIGQTGTLQNGPSGTEPASLVIRRGDVSGTVVWDLNAGQLQSAESRIELEATLDTVLGRTQLQQLIVSHVVRIDAEAAGDPVGPQR